MRDDIDWSLTTWEGSRRQQHQEFLALPFRRKLEIIEQLGEVSEQLRSPRPHAAATQVRESASAYRAAAPRQPVDQAVLDEIVRRVVEVAQPDRIILFGSAARGELGPDSDIDLLVIKSGVEHRRRLAQRIHRHLFGVEAAVDVVVATPEDVETYRNAVGTIIRPALREGREIYAA